MMVIFHLCVSQTLLFLLLFYQACSLVSFPIASSPCWLDDRLVRVRAYPPGCLLIGFMIAYVCPLLFLLLAWKFDGRLCLCAPEFGCLHLLAGWSLVLTPLLMVAPWLLPLMV
jgi:hypothetical protein